MIPFDPLPTEPLSQSGHWQARLELVVSATAAGSRLSRCRHCGPLYVQKPFYPEGPDLAHIYILHPPGGLVSGDCLEIDVTVGEDAHALLTTPGAGRVYRARPDRTLQRQQVNMQIAQGSSVEWLPLETIVYRDANARLDTHIELSQNSHFIGWEITSLGLPASGIAFERGQLRQRVCISRDGEPLLIESVQLTDSDPEVFSGRAGLRGFPITGFFVAGPFQKHQLDDELMNQCRAITDIDLPQISAGVSRVGEFLLGRVLSDCSEQSHRMFMALWALLRPLLLGRPACLPRVWAQKLPDDLEKSK